MTEERALDLIERILALPGFQMVLFILFLLIVVLIVLAVIMWRIAGGMSRQSDKQSDHEQSLVSLLAQQNKLLSSESASKAALSAAISELRMSNETSHREDMEFKRQQLTVHAENQRFILANATAIKELSISFKDMATWNKTMGESVQELRGEITLLSRDIGDLKNALPRSTQGLLDAALKPIQTRITEILQKLDTPPPTPPTEPASALPPAPPKTADADAGVESAVKPEDAGEKNDSGAQEAA